MTQESVENLDESQSPKTKKKWTNRERVLVFCSRGASFQDRHLMQDFRSLMPHAKQESKMDKKQKLSDINEICEMKNCTKCLYFESRKKKDLYLWMSNAENGPSAKFLVRNVHTMGELRLSGNCLKGSRPILSFEDSFDSTPHLRLLKQLFTQTFGTPNYHPKSQPFIDHVMTFSISDDQKIWFRNYQILEDDTGRLEEIGPRMVLEPIKIFEGSFCGAVLYENNSYVSPNIIRRQVKSAHAGKYIDRVDAKKSFIERKRKAAEEMPLDPLEDVFETNKTEPKAPEAKKIKKEIERKSKKKKKAAKVQE